MSDAVHELILEVNVSGQRLSGVVDVLGTAAKALAPELKLGGTKLLLCTLRTDDQQKKNARPLRNVPKWAAKSVLRSKKLKQT